MKKWLLAPVLAGISLTANAQLTLERFNAPGIPAGWTMINDGKTPSAALSARIVAGLTANAWMKWPRSPSGGPDSMMISSSIFTPAGTADRWLISPPFKITDPNTLISWEEFQPATVTAGTTETMEIKLGPATAAVAADFSTSLFSGPVSASATPSKKGLSLSAYNGQTVRIAFRNTSNNSGVTGLDNIQTEILPAKTDLELSAVNPNSGSLESFGTVGSTVTISGQVANKGTTTVSSFKVSYKAGTGAVITETKTISILPFTNTSFSFTTTLPLTAVSTPVKVWVELSGDGTPANDTLSTRVAGYTTKAAKRIVAEEPTGTWCSWCTRGIVFMDSVHKKYPANFSVIAVHNGDPMVVPAYDAHMNKYISGYPSLVIDRRLSGDPGEVFTYYASEKDKFGVADITAVPTITGTDLSLAVSVTPRVEVHADYRLALVLTEDDVSGTTKGWEQANAYSGRTDGPMRTAEYNFITLPNPVPAAMMKYDFVARGIYPGPTGAAGSLPAIMTSGTTYKYTFSGISLGSWNKNKMHAVVMMINNVDGTILNSQTVKLTTVGIRELNTAVSALKIYPNPANETVSADFTLTEATSALSLELLDLTGRVVKTITQSELAAGTYSVPVNVSALPGGVYLLKISSDKGIVTERFSIIK